MNIPGGVWTKIDDTGKKTKSIFRFFCFFGYHPHSRHEYYNGIGDNAKTCFHCGRRITTLIIWPDVLKKDEL